MARSAAHCASAQKLLDATAATRRGELMDGNALRVTALRALSHEECRNVVRHWLRWRALRAPDETRLRELCERMISVRDDAHPVVRWPGAEVHRHGGRLHALLPLPKAPAPQQWSCRRQRRLDIDGAGTLQLVTDVHGDLSLDALPAHLDVRFRHGGERVAQSAGRKPLKEVLRERGLPPWLRHRLPLLYEGDELLAVPGVWLAARLRASRGSQRRVRLVWTWAREMT